MRLLIIYDYFFPGYKAGGPIQSLTNMVIAIENEYEVFVLTSAYDLNSTVPHEGIRINIWNSIHLPGSFRNTKVFYADRNYLNKISVKKLIEKINPHYIYLNGIFSYIFFLFPLLALKGLPEKNRVVVCPRGMLQSGALAVKPIKKKLYLWSLRILGILKIVYWHATNEEERQAIEKHFPVHKGVVIAYNIPKPPRKQVALNTKEEGKLRLVYLSLITEKKKSPFFASHNW